MRAPQQKKAVLDTGFIIFISKFINYKNSSKSIFTQILIQIKSKLNFALSILMHQASIELRYHVILHAKTFEPTLHSCYNPASIYIDKTKFTNTIMSKTFMETAPEDILIRKTVIQFHKFRL